MPALPANRLQRIQRPSIRLPLRHQDGRIEIVELWREDRLDPGDGTVYLVLDFAEQEQLIPGTDRYQATGGLVIEMQRLDAATGEGLSQPTITRVDPSVAFTPDPDSERSQTGGRPYDTRPLTNLTHLPVSSRRNQVDVPVSHE